MSLLFVRLNIGNIINVVPKKWQTNYSLIALYLSKYLPWSLHKLCINEIKTKTKNHSNLNIWMFRPLTFECFELKTLTGNAPMYKMRSFVMYRTQLTQAWHPRRNGDMLERKCGHVTRKSILFLYFILKYLMCTKEYT